LVFNILKYRKHLIGQNKLTVEHINQLTYMMQFNGLEQQNISEVIHDEWCDEIKTVEPSVSTDTLLRKKNTSKTSRK